MDLFSNSRIKTILSMINGLGLKEKIFDIGCHNGMLTSLIKNRENEFYGIEASEYGFSKAKEKKFSLTPKLLPGLSQSIIYLCEVI